MDGHDRAAQRRQTLLDRPMNIQAVDRAISIYEAIADRTEPKGAREKLSQHLGRLYVNGEHDHHRLTVHGLSFLRDFDRNRNA
ncbi:hypothetical protein ONR75_13440 [Rhodopseudomonas sp. P2A-2r]|uniref:hypothetical protein n=1 Tax=Rhodopseudomonas sp. P2A-2r TaxID=2991972 RepID=UPI002234CAA0|nr:hypothetical protein [Rhodopseudomonas sp. P2A-2r]UZE51513.1 hypothetical protein ONR75_13440 [Rhodopseudomonas sp. P2A-2r]